MKGFLTAPSAGEVNEVVDLEEAFTGVVELLCTKQSRENGFDTLNHESHVEDSVILEQRHRSLMGTISSIECPRLSLRHEGHLKIDQNSRVEAEQEAASLLARPVRVEVERNENRNAELEAPSLLVHDLPETLMKNIYESFAVLVDSRLRVYAKLFLRHLTGLVTKQGDAFAILQMGQKLETLQKIGGQIIAQSMQLHVELQDQEPEEIDPGQFQQALQLEATMELLVPSPTGQNRSLTVRHKSQGHIKGIVHDEDKKLCVSLELDTKGLLKNMMDQASLMVAQIVETTNDAFCVPEPKMERGESFVVMPPPMPRKRSAPSAGLDLLSEAAVVKESVIITPDLNAKKSDPTVIPALHLEADQDNHDDNECTADVDDLSLDQCASIIDDVFGAMDDALLRGRCLKKSRTTQ